MVRTCGRESVNTLLAFVAAYFFTNGLFEWACLRHQNRNNEDLEEIRLLLPKVDTRTIDKRWPRDEFVFSMDPWRVKREMKSLKFGCPHTPKVDLVKILVIIKSAPTYSARRESVRKTWGRISHLENMVIHPIFIVGMAARKIQLELELENERYGDILQYVGVDDYRHVAYKVLAGMQWAKENLPDDYFYATSDDDLIVNMTGLPRQLRMRMRQARYSVSKTSLKSQDSVFSNVPILCIYGYVEYDRPIRDNNGPDAKYYIDPREFSMTRLPPFCLGGFYMAPVVKISKLYDISRRQKALPMDDVWITGIMRLLLPEGLREIDAIDKTAVGFERSKYVMHLRGDLSDTNVERTVLEAWDSVFKDLSRKKHCVRKLFDGS